MTEIKLKRAYEPSSPDDGFRIYVDRLWPQGLSHETFHYDLWEKQISPSTQLREWFHVNRIGRWDEFTRKYLAELKVSEAFKSFCDIVRQHRVVTLLFSSKDREHNNAVIVKEALQQLLA